MTLFINHLHWDNLGRFVSIQKVTVELCDLIWTHSRLYPIELFETHVDLPIIFSGVMILFDETFEMIDIIFFFPRTSLYVPIQPFDKVVCFASLLFSIQDLLNCVIVFLIIYDLVLLARPKFICSFAVHMIIYYTFIIYTYPYQKYSLIKLVILLKKVPFCLSSSSSSSSCSFFTKASFVFLACSLKALSLN